MDFKNVTALPEQLMYDDFDFMISTIKDEIVFLTEEGYMDADPSTEEVLTEDCLIKGFVDTKYDAIGKLPVYCSNDYFMKVRNVAISSRCGIDITKLNDQPVLVVTENLVTNRHGKQDIRSKPNVLVPAINYVLSKAVAHHLIYGTIPESVILNCEMLSKREGLDYEVEKLAGAIISGSYSTDAAYAVMFTTIIDNCHYLIGTNLTVMQNMVSTNSPWNDVMSKYGYSSRSTKTVEEKDGTVLQVPTEIFNFEVRYLNS
jgi:hypothetical protein